MEYKVMQLMSFVIEEGYSEMRYVPTSIEKSEIKMITPFMTAKGKQYKNVSVIYTFSESMNVIGNHKIHNKNVFGRNPIKGFKL